MMRAFAVVACLTSLVVACDPCDTTFSCEQAPRVAVVGQILDEHTGLPVPGVRVEMRWVSGVAFLNASSATTTGDNGTFELEIQAAEVGEAVVRIRVESPGAQPYDVLAVATRATVITGEATVLRPWVSANPKLPYVVELYREGTANERIANTEVEFRRTGGVRMFRDGVEVTSTSGTTNEVGWWFPFIGLTTDAAGDVIGDLIIRRPAPLTPFVFPNLHFGALPNFPPSVAVVRLAVGSN